MLSSLSTGFFNGGRRRVIWGGVGEVKIRSRIENICRVNGNIGGKESYKVKVSCVNGYYRNMS